VLSSVHAFAVDPARGAFILALLVIAIGGSLVLFALRAPALRSTGSFAPISRESALILNNLLLATAALTVFLGTLYPLFLDVIGGDKVSVGAPYYNATFVPLMVPLVLLMAAGPMMTWKRADLAGVLLRLRLAFGLALAVAVIMIIATKGHEALAPLGIGLAAWLLFGTLKELADRIRLFQAPWDMVRTRLRHTTRASWGMSIAHAGLAVTIAGITIASGWQQEAIQTLHPGESIALAGDVYRFDRVEPLPGPNYSAEQATVAISHDGRTFATVHPSRLTYPLQRMTTTDVAIHTDGFSDRYVVLGDPQPDGGWIFRIYYNPLVPWVWFGALIMVLGGILSLSDRRLRIGAPVRKPKRAGGELAA